MWLSATVVPCSNLHDVRHHKLLAYCLLVEQQCCLDDLGLPSWLIWSMTSDSVQVCLNACLPAMAAETVCISYFLALVQCTC